MLLNLASFSVVASSSDSLFDSALMDPWIPMPEIELFPKGEFSDLRLDGSGTPTSEEDSGIVSLPISGASVPEEEWNRTFGGTGDDRGYSVQQTADGGYVITGTANSDSLGYIGDVWLIKTDSLGNEMWNKTFGGTDYDWGHSVQETSDSGYVIIGSTKSYSAGGSDVWIIKTDFSGNKLWDKTFGGSSNDYGSSVQQTADGGYIIAGTTSSYGLGPDDVWLIKTDSFGNELWNKTFGGNSWDRGYSVRETSDNGYIIAGSTHSYGAGSFDAWLIKTDSAGEEIWNKTFGGAGGDGGKSVQQTSDGGYIIAGHTAPYLGAYDIWLIKTDFAGKEIFNSTLIGPNSDFGESVQQTADGGYIIVGDNNAYGGGDTDIWLIKTDSYGNEMWNKTFGGSSNDYGYSVQQTADGGYIVTGFTGPYGAYDVWLIKVRPDTVSNTVDIDEAASDSWIDLYSSNSDDNEAVIWYEISPEDFSGQLNMTIQDQKGNVYPWDRGFISATGGRHSLTWDGRVASEYVSQPNNPYYISLVLQKDGQEVARSGDHKIWVGRPVVLLHGIFSSKGDMEKTKLYDELGKSFYVSSVEYNGGIIGSSTGSITTYAGKLDDEIKAIKGDTGAKKVDIVAHSMGGLVARWYIQRLDGRDVGKLIMIGTPNHGADMARLPKGALKSLVNIILTNLGLSQLGYSADILMEEITSNFAINQMIPHRDFLQDLNNNDCCAYDIEKGKECDDETSKYSRYAVVTSKHWFPTLAHQHKNIFGIPFDVYWATSGDGVVPFYSAKLSGVSIWSEDDSFHAGGQTNSQAIIDEIRSLLQQTDESILYNPSLNYMDVLDSDFNPAYWTDPIEDLISTGEVKYYNISVDPSSTEAHFLVVWDNGTLNVTLSAPNGTEIEMTSPENYAAYSAEAPQAGNWTVEISPFSIPTTGANVTIQAFIANPFFLGVATEKTVFDPEEPIKITAYLGDEDSAVASAIVVATITKPDNSVENLTLYDDGLHEDNETADGIYANEFTNTSLWGTYRILVSASGETDGRELERETFTTVWVELYPDLTLDSSDISFSKNRPVPGEKITISARIHNIGDADAANSSIFFYQGGSATGVLIGEDVINVSGGETALASVSWSAADEGRYKIQALVSPFNEFLESNYSNNDASRFIDVVSQISEDANRRSTRAGMITQG